MFYSTSTSSSSRCMRIFLFNLNLLISASICFILPPSIPPMAAGGKFPNERIIARGAGGKFPKQRARTPYNRPYNAGRRRCHPAPVEKEGTGCHLAPVEKGGTGCHLAPVEKGGNGCHLAPVEKGGTGYLSGLVDPRGAGGKFPKRSSRRARKTPYDRPSNAARRRYHLAPVEKGGTGWLSRLADPMDVDTARDATDAAYDVRMLQQEIEEMRRSRIADRAALEEMQRSRADDRAAMDSIRERIERIASIVQMFYDPMDVDTARDAID